MKKKTQYQLKKELDKWFSLFIRLRDSKDGYGYCFTCKKKVHYKEAHAGHFVSRNILATRFDEDNVKLQCIGCNIFGDGKVLDFQDNLIDEIGFEKVEALRNKRHHITKLDNSWYEERIDRYKAKVEKLLTPCGNLLA